MIRRLTLENWRAYEHLELDFQPGATFVVAPNGVGKSSIVEGARFALFGFVPPAREGAARVARTGATSATVEVELPSGRLLTVTRPYPAKPRAASTPAVLLDGEPQPADGGPLGVVAAVALLLVFAFSLSWVWTAVGLKMPTPEAVMQMSMTVLFPVTFASNVFVDPQTMPGWVQVFVNNNPITHLATASRGLMHGSVAAVEVAWVLGWSAALVAVFAPLTMRLYNKER